MADQETDVNGVQIDDHEVNDPSQDPQAPDPLLGESAQSAGALSKVGTRSDQQQQAANERAGLEGLRTEYGSTQKQLSGAYGAQIKNLQDATQRILTMNFGPSKQEQDYRVAAAMGTGDVRGRYNPAGVATAYAENLAGQRDAEMKKQQLLMQYGSQIPASVIAQLNARSGALTQQMRISSGLVGKDNAQADKPFNTPPKFVGQTGMVFNQALNNGQGGMEYHPEIAAAHATQKAQDAKATAAARIDVQNAILGKLDDSTLNRLATAYNTTGIMPSGLSRGGPQIPLAVAKRAVQLADANGDSDSSVIAKQYVNKANAANLTNLTKQFGQFSGFQNTMNNVGEQAKQLSAQVDRTNVPILNQIFQSGQRHFTGNTPLAVFDTANNTFVQEYAKIMSGSMSNTPTTDAMSKNAHERLNTAMRNGTYAAVVDQMRTEGQMKTKGLTDNINAVKQELGMLSPTPPAPGPTAPPAVRPGMNLPLKNAQGWVLHKDAKGVQAYVGPNGQFQEVH